MSKRDISFPQTRGSAELDRLGRTLQSMFTHLSESERVLEATVADRTRELADTAAELKLVNDGVASIIGRLELEGRILYANRRYHYFF